VEVGGEAAGGVGGVGVGVEAGGVGVGTGSSSRSVTLEGRIACTGSGSISLRSGPGNGV
jgi:hypothetical protein